MDKKTLIIAIVVTLVVFIATSILAPETFKTPQGIWLFFLTVIMFFGATRRVKK